MDKYTFGMQMFILSFFFHGSSPGKCVWDWLEINYRPHVYCKKETCHFVQQCGSFVFNSLWPVTQRKKTCDALLAGFVHVRNISIIYPLITDMLSFQIIITSICLSTVREKVSGYRTLLLVA